MKTIDELDALYEKATPGPWTQWVGHGSIYAGEVAQNERCSLSYTGTTVRIAECDGEDGWDDENVENALANAALIVALVNAWPEVRERLRRAERIEEAARGACTMSLLLDTTPPEYTKTIDARRRNLSEMCTTLRAALTEEPPR